METAHPKNLSKYLLIIQAPIRLGILFTLLGLFGLNINGNAQAQNEQKTNQQFFPKNYCEQRGEYAPNFTGVKVAQIYISETNGIVWESCFQIDQVKLSLRENGDLVLLERGINTNIEYYNTGSRSGKLKQINDTSLDYYTAGYYKKGKPRKIGNITLDYYTSGFSAGRLKQIGNVFFEYYGQGSEKGRLRKINGVTFNYLVNRFLTPDGKEKETLKMETKGTLEGISMVII